jgi:hypothetical protein
MPRFYHGRQGAGMGAAAKIATIFLSVPSES